MASINKSKTLFGFTSPRTLEKSVPEIQLLVDNFSGEKWERNQELHKKFFLKLFASETFEGNKPPTKPALAGRDRITRAVKAYGFVDLSPTVSLTEAGKELLESRRPHEVFLKQMLKFQLPSPYHTSKNSRFNVKPYLELLRLIYVMEGISKTELALFFLQLTDYQKFDDIIDKINIFRRNFQLEKAKTSRRTYVDSCHEKEVLEIYNEEIHNIYQGDVAKLLQEKDTDIAKYRKVKDFIKKKKQTMRDYGDAFMRHIRATKIISFDKRTLRLIIDKSKIEDVKFLLDYLNRDAETFPTTKDFKQYLFSSTNIELFADNEVRLVEKIKSLGEVVSIGQYSVNQLKDKIESIEEEIYKTNLEKTTKELKTYNEFDDIIDIFEKIKNKEVPDAPLFLEWNIWRALVMINYSKWVEGNFIRDLEGIPINTAGGNKADIEAEYSDFGLITEVTMSGGNKQYEMEGEPVARHFGNFKRKLGKDTYCLFIAPSISEATLAHYFIINQKSVKFYGGKTKIIPLNIEQFIRFINVAKNKNFNDSSKLKNWMEDICLYNQDCKDEEDWSEYIDKSIELWVA